jgi:hypothetical protein
MANIVISWQHVYDLAPKQATTSNIAEGGPDVEHVLKSAGIYDCVELRKIRL